MTALLLVDATTDHIQAAIDDRSRLAGLIGGEEIGDAIAPSFQRRGLATDAAGRLVRRAT